ncbi:MAG: asparagine synthase C-terminal domain-containing protein [Thermoplasmata archaeon]
MEMQIILNYQYGFPWYKYNNTYVKGYVIKENKLCRNHDFARLIDSIDTFSKIVTALKSFHGIFVIVTKKEEKIYLASDITRTFPLFYTIHNNTVYISDDAFYLQQLLNLKLDSISSNEFLKCGYVTGDATLLKNLRQLQAGEIIELNSRKFFRRFYHNYTVKNDELSTLSEKELQSNLLDILTNAISRLIIFAAGAPIVVPLSGGFDSRLIVALLKILGYKNVICYTYGKRDSSEVLTAQKVSEKLGYTWHFVEQNDKIIPKNYTHTQWFYDFYKYGFNYVSTLHLQDFFVFKFLHEKENISENSVIVPGHSGDFLGGSHIRKLPIPKSVRMCLHTLTVKHYVLNGHVPIAPAVKEKIFSYITKCAAQGSLLYSIDENWNLKERQAKYIINSNRTYEFFGYRHAIPLWDIDLVEFFRRLPLHYKVNKNLYADTIKEYIFRPLDIIFDQKAFAKGFKLKLYFKIVKELPVTPYLRYLFEVACPSITRIPIKNLFRTDENNFASVLNPIIMELGKRYYLINTPGHVAEWCLAHTGIS